MPNDRDSSSSPRPKGSRRSSSDPILPWGESWDKAAQKHFDRSDWIELAATVLLSLATIVAAWSAYQSTRWSGEQSITMTTASAKRIEATQQNAIYTSQVQLDAIAWVTFLEHIQAGDEKGAAFLRDRFRKEFVPAFDAWIALVPEGEIPPGTPFDLSDYRPEAMRKAERLNAEADALSADAAEANRIGDNFVLVAVVMASVLFCAGVGTKVKGRKLRLTILVMGAVLFIGGLSFMLSLPQIIAI
ncbi:hypothetical protein A8B84_10165 [Marinobacter sp. EhC06]|jgi:hypothetical protein|uniref:hypothetical protein n=1 Tax=Marinobacter TaxID=2742 RepID=UPI0007D99C0C|nr:MULTISPECIES: hypothetical protein [unclassified Marinobacter]OAN88939.1 hypothetical protein A8B80_08370 [Marinobacter sp. EhN04]OAN91922.1 hypothetical protein A8B84_10165 [Marinobacter sp. EhC06]